MSTDEMREYCRSIQPYGLPVKVRLKNGTEILTGKIANVEAERFQLESKGDVQHLRYEWVARLNA